MLTYPSNRNRLKLVQEMKESRGTGDDDRGSKRDSSHAETGGRARSNGRTGSPTAALSGDEESTELDRMQQLMGFSGFSTTKGSLVEDNYAGSSRGAVKKNKKREYRQYMNRRGTCNISHVKRPLLITMNQVDSIVLYRRCPKSPIPPSF